jgi:uncharacterized RDD family membrane protein YckC
MNFAPRPAPLSRRVAAGAIDTALIGLLCALSFAVPMVLRGVVLPMWGVLAVLVGYAVVPLAFLKRTVGMHLLDLELVSRQGHAVDLANLLFRELLGRGLFPAAWLLTVLGGLIAAYAGVGGTAAPPGLAGVMTLACMAALAAAAGGHLVALGRPDQRTLADLIAGSYVVAGPALPEPTDDDELAEARAQRHGVLVRIAVFEILLVGSVLALPWLLTARGGETPDQKISRLKRETLRQKFEQSPGSEALAADLQREYLRAGLEEEAKAVVDRHRAAASLREADRELRLRAQFEAQRDRPNAEALILLLDEQGRVDEAVAVYREWLGPAPEPSALAGFGNYLATNQRTAEAITVLQQAVSRDPLVAYGHTLLGVCLQREGRLAEAREHLHLALLDDPKDEDARDALAAVEAQGGALPPQERLALRRRLDGWRRDAGVPR